MKRQLVLFITVLLLVLAGCFPDGTPTPTPTLTPDPGPQVNLLANGDMVYVSGEPLGECDSGTLCVTLPFWWALNYEKPEGAIERWPGVNLPETDAFFAEPKTPALTPNPWGAFLLAQFGNTAQEAKVESARAVFAIQNSGHTVQRGHEYYVAFHLTPFILADQPAAVWLAGNEAAFAVAQAAGEIPPLPFVRQSAFGADWYDTAIWRVLVLPFEGGIPFHDSGWFDGYDVQAQTGNEGYSVGFGDYVTFDTFFVPDETHCTAGPTCKVTVVLEMAVRDVDGVVPYLGSMYVHAAEMVPTR